MDESALASSRGISGGATRVASRGGSVATVSPRDSTERRVRPARDEPPGGPGLPDLLPMSLDLTSAGEGASERNLVGVLQIPADRQPARECRHPDGRAL